MRRAAWRLLGAGCLAVLALSGWTAWKGWTAYRSLEEAGSRLPELAQHVTALDAPGAAATVADIRASTERARVATQDPVWRLASRFPWGGQNLGALSTSAAAVDRLADQGLPRLVDVTAGAAEVRGSVTELRRPDGAVVARAVQALGPLEGAAERARVRLRDVDAEYLLPQVDALLTRLEDQVDLESRARAVLDRLPPGLRSFLG